MQKAITVLIYGGLGTVKSTLAAAYFLRECIGDTATPRHFSSISSMRCSTRIGKARIATGGY